MDWFSIADDFFDNSSVSAFLGAAAAFLLVYLTDLRRKSRKKKTLRETIGSALALGKRKHASVTANRDLLRDRDTIHPGEIQAFPLSMIDALLLDLYDEVPHDERSAMEALVFRMRAIRLAPPFGGTTSSTMIALGRLLKMPSPARSKSSKYVRLFFTCLPFESR